MLACLKIGRRTDRELFVIFLNQFFQLLQRKCLLNNWKIYHLSPFSTLKTRLNLKLNESARKISSFEEKFLLPISVFQKRILYIYKMKQKLRFLQKFLKNEKHCDSLSAKLNEREEKLSKLNIRNFNKRTKLKKGCVHYILARLKENVC